MSTWNLEEHILARRWEIWWERRESYWCCQYKNRDCWVWEILIPHPWAVFEMVMCSVGIGKIWSGSRSIIQHIRVYTHLGSLSRRPTGGIYIFPPDLILPFIRLSVLDMIVHIFYWPQQHQWFSMESNWVSNILATGLAGHMGGYLLPKLSSILR